MSVAQSLPSLTRYALILAWRSAPYLLAAHLALALLAGLLPVAAPWLLKLVLDSLTAGETFAVLGWLTAGLGLVALASAVVVRADAYVRAELGRAVERTSQAELYDAVNRQIGLARFEDPAFRDRLQLAQYSGKAAPVVLIAAATRLVSGVITLAGFAWSFAVIAPWMALCIALAAIPTVRAEIWLSRRRVALDQRVAHGERRGFFYGELLTRAESIKEIRLFGLGSYFRERLVGELTRIHAERRGMDRRELRVEVTLSVLGVAIASAGTVWAVAEAVRGNLSAGDLTMFITAVAATQAALTAIVNDFASGHTASLGFAYYREIVTAALDLAVPAAPATPTTLRSRGGKIELRDVWFRYAPDRPWVLRGVDLTLEAGRTVALVGLNGSGKSTLIKLLCRLYDPARGSIRWNGTDLRELDVEALRARIATVFQDFVRYDLTARENIALGDLSTMNDLDTVSAAARSALAHGTIEALPKGYETLLTKVFFDEADRQNPETGVFLSGGEWQRIAVARSLVRHRSELLIMDEPSSGLDPDAEFKLHSRLREFRADRATLLISHRLNTVRDADLIAVLDHGTVVEQGSHAELMSLRGQYAQLFRQQADGYLVDA